MLDLFVFLGSILGISAMIALVVFTKLWVPARIQSVQDAVERLDQDASGFAAGQGALSADGQVALIEEKGGTSVGLVAARGDNYVIRYLKPGSIDAARMSEDACLDIRLNDYTFAPVRMVFDEAEPARFWADKLNALQV